VNGALRPSPTDASRQAQGPRTTVVVHPGVTALHRRRGRRGMGLGDRPHIARLIAHLGPAGAAPILAAMRRGRRERIERDFTAATIGTVLHGMAEPEVARLRAVLTEDQRTAVAQLQDDRNIEWVRATIDGVHVYVGEEAGRTTVVVSKFDLNP